MTPYERFALCQYLTEFEDDKTFSEIIKIVRNGGNDFNIVWEPFESIDPNELGSIIRQTATEAVLWFAPKDLKHMLKA